MGTQKQRKASDEPQVPGPGQWQDEQPNTAPSKDEATAAARTTTVNATDEEAQEEAGRTPVAPVADADK